MKIPLSQNQRKDINEIFGQISPPDSMRIGVDDPILGVSRLISFGILFFITVAGFVLLLFLLWGAFDWITSGGEKEKIAKAQSKITNALIGIVLVFVVLTIFNVVAGNILGIINIGPDGNWTIKIPTLR
ncbi:MAG: hypothetical protein NZL96_01575 [Patescibacteria group bacterium]|nr:hypothetical protein [Patescibacteria group bacterium]